MNMRSFVVFIAFALLSVSGWGGELLSHAPTLEVEVGFAPGLFALGDLNGNGRPDIAFADQKNERLVVFFMGNDGSVNFVREIPLETSGPPRAVFVGDINRDGLNDIILTSSRRVHFFLGAEEFDNERVHRNNNLSGSFRPARPATAGSLLKGASDVLIGPVLLRWRRTGGFQPGYVRGPAANDNSVSLLGDLNNDGLDEAIFGVRREKGVRIYYGPMVGTVVRVDEISRFIELTAPFQISRLAVGDLNDNGRPDIIAGGGAGILIYHQNSPTGFQDGAEPSVVIEGIGPFVAVADLDGDGREELIAGDTSAPSDQRAVYLFKQREAGGVPDKVTDAVQRISVPHLTALEIGDMSGNGRSDIVVAVNAPDEAGGKLSVYSPK